MTTTRKLRTSHLRWYLQLPEPFAVPSWIAAAYQAAGIPQGEHLHRYGTKVERQARRLWLTDSRRWADIHPSFGRVHYRTLVHDAILRSSGVDSYTGQSLRWDLWARDYEQTQHAEVMISHRHEYPSFDHEHRIVGGLRTFVLHLCAFSTNDMKGDRSREEFINWCRRVVSHADAMGDTCINTSVPG